MDENEELLKILLETFQIEATEGLTNIENALINLGKKSNKNLRQESIESIYREVHSLKGAARAVNLTVVETVFHGLEDVLSLIKNNLLTIDDQILDNLENCFDVVSDLIKNTNKPEQDSHKQKALEIINWLSEIASNPESKIKETEKTRQSAKLDQPIEKSNTDAVNQNLVSQNSELATVRLASSKLDHLLTQAEDLIALKPQTNRQVNQLDLLYEKVNNSLTEYSKIASDAEILKANLNKAQVNTKITDSSKRLSQVLQYLDWSSSLLRVMSDELYRQKEATNELAYDTSIKIDAFLDGLIDILTVPFSSLLVTYPKIVKDLAKSSSKKVELNITGDNVEIDRRILEYLKTPLMHIIRNSIDYGIEVAENRTKKGKSETGQISIYIERISDNRIMVEISDDGKGYDFDKIREIYQKNHKLSSQEVSKLSEDQLLQYTFTSGVSTSDIVTDLSGRGLGLSIVKEKVEAIGGEISISSKQDIGTSMKIIVPINLQVYRGVIIRTSGHDFVVQTTKVNTFKRIDLNEIKKVKNRDLIEINGKIVPIIYLSGILDLPNFENESQLRTIMVIGENGEQYAIIIDDVIGEQEILVKNFNSHLKRVKNILGATVIDNGKVVPILNVNDLIRSANQLVNNTNIDPTITEPKKSKQSILVVEDSITSRTLLTNILESAGYEVDTAIDGVDGFTKLKEKEYVAIVSDVEMPRMNGFDLTSKIRADKNVSELPVVLVTGLSKNTDKEKGIEVGANAYIVKSSFDESNLLEVLDRLI